MRYPQKAWSLWNYVFARHASVKAYSEGRDTEAPLPGTILIRITSRNNLRPTCCGKWAEVWNRDKQKGGSFDKELTTQEWKGFIEDASRWRPYIFIEGGEPLLRKDIVELVRFISSKGLLCGLRTNATFLAPLASSLKEAGLDYLLCNLDAPNAKLNEKITGDQESFESALEGIRSIKPTKRGARAPRLQLTTTISAYNQSHLVEMAELASQLKVDVFAISFPVFTTEALENLTSVRFFKEFGFKPKFWEGFVDGMEEINPSLIKEQLRIIKSKHWNFEYRQFPPDKKGFDVSAHFSSPKRPHFESKCLLPWLLAAIFPNGDVATCWDHPDYITGNIATDSLQRIWGGEKYRKFREVIKQGIFASCARCNGLYL